MVCSQIPNHSRSIKCRCCKPRRAPCEGLTDHVGSSNPTPGPRRKEWTEEGRKEGRSGSPFICPSVRRSTEAPEAWTERAVRRDMGERPGQGEGKRLGTLRVSGARAGLLGQARPPRPRAASALLGASGVHMHAPRHVHLPAHTHTRAHTHTHTRGLRTRRCLGPRGHPGSTGPAVPGSPPARMPCSGCRGACRAQEVQRWAWTVRSPVLRKGVSWSGSLPSSPRPERLPGGRACRERRL